MLEYFLLTAVVGTPLVLALKYLLSSFFFKQFGTSFNYSHKEVSLLELISYIVFFFRKYLRVLFFISNVINS